ncbi:DJ-1/PfpI family protein [Streptomyces sp. AV19]|uniref:DJ-1/PfpI family protein n=1 Tax=Streptomyces sp. AV19 TaxID=2793068 RepID=UPI0018FEEEE1|nr:DJ-1/PfpI family protein [Streptomyces sp. AV19]MBH1937273.1 DJ-1/PfpI family protein [Streptomyces sp. AV19]MDG4536751.1 DJ-1/PfpI family protein [Streptomyces sp. AV19]
MHAHVVLFDGFDPLDVIAPYEVLHAAGMVSGGAVSVELVSAEGARTVPSSIEGLTLTAMGQLDPFRADLVLVPGSAPSADELEAALKCSDAQSTVATGALRDQARSTLPPLLARAVQRPNVTVAAVCGGSLLLALADLIPGRRATTHNLGMDLLSASGVRTVPNARVVDDGDLVTSAGVTSGLDLALHLVERELGPRIAHSVEILLAYERRGVVWSSRGRAPRGFTDIRAAAR